MKATWRDRHTVAAGAAACAVCCATPSLGLLGIGLGGAAATAASLLFAGTVFAIVVAAASAGLFWRQRTRRPIAPSCGVSPGPVPVTLTGRATPDGNTSSDMSRPVTDQARAERMTL